MTLANRVMCAPESTDRPDGVGVLLDRRLDDLLRRLVQPGVDHLHARVAQGAGDDLGAAVMTVEPGLGHDDTKGALARALAHGAHTTDPGPSARDGRRSRVDG